MCYTCGDVRMEFVKFLRRDVSMDFVKLVRRCEDELCEVCVGCESRLCEIFMENGLRQVCRCEIWVETRGNALCGLCGNVRTRFGRCMEM